MIEFKDIQIEGFGSILEPLTYQLDNPGLNLIQGKNGSGKTTIFSAFTWCLYGQSLKVNSEITPWLQVQPKTFKGTKVEVHLTIKDKKVEIIRCKDYSDKVEGSKGANRTLLKLDGVYQEKLRDKKDVQKAIEDLLGMSFNLFKNTLVFGQKLTRLLAEKGDAQKKLFDEAFEATFINNARDKAKKDKEALNLEYSGIQSEYQLHKQAYLTWVTYIKNAKEMWELEHSKVLSDLKDRIAHLSNEIKALKEDKPNYEQLIAQEQSLKAEMEALQPKADKIGKIAQEHFRVDFGIGQTRAEMEGLKKEAVELAKSLSSKVNACSVCGSPINAEKKKELDEKLKVDIKTKLANIDSLRKEVKEAELRLKELTSSLTKYTKYKESYREKSRELDELLSIGYDQILYRPGMIKPLVLKKGALEEKLKAEEEVAPNLEQPKKDKAAALAKLRELQPKYIELRKKVRLLTWLIEEPLSNKGLKAYIFNSMLSSVNAQLQAYARYTGFTVVLAIDLDSGRKNFEATVYYKKKQVSYNDLSGGQQQLVDVCLAFSIHEVITNSRPINILLMDEVFESLDSDNIELISELLYLKGRTLSVHLISHQAGLSSIKLASTLQLEAREGISRLA